MWNTKTLYHRGNSGGVQFIELSFKNENLDRVRTEEISDKNLIASIDDSEEIDAYRVLAQQLHEFQTDLDNLASTERETNTAIETGSGRERLAALDTLREIDDHRRELTSSLERVKTVMHAAEHDLRKLLLQTRLTVATQIREQSIADRDAAFADIAKLCEKQLDIIAVSQNRFRLASGDLDLGATGVLNSIKTGAVQKQPA
ncbi:MAG: hypothetical protein SGI77_04355 [Pirellulaceae bacterium]|nr:hypothetical protein [Pirellulaceae bacterium]